MELPARDSPPPGSSCCSNEPELAATSFPTYVHLCSRGCFELESLLTFPQGLEPCCFPLPEGRQLLLSLCGSLHPWSYREHLHRAALSIHTNPPGQRQQCPSCLSHGPAPFLRSCPEIPGDVALALPSLPLLPCSHQLPQAAVLLQRLCDFPGALGSDGIFLQAAKGRKAPVNGRCHIPMVAPHPAGWLEWGTPRPGHSLQGHQPVVGQQGLSQEGGPVLLDGVVLEAVGDRSEAVPGCFHSRARGFARLQGSGHLPWGLLALVPGLRKGSGLQASLTRSLLPSCPMGYSYFHETAPWELRAQKGPRPSPQPQPCPTGARRQENSSFLAQGCPSPWVCGSCSCSLPSTPGPGYAQGLPVCWPLEPGKTQWDRRGMERRQPWGSAPGGATEVETYFRESRIWFFFSASARAFAPVGPMELLRRLGQDRQKSQA